MVTINPIRNEEDHEAALSRLAEIFQAELCTPEGDERDILSDLVEHYEDRRHPIAPPDPIAAIEFRMDQGSLTRRDLVPHIGSRAKVSEVLSGKRPITMSMARALYRHLGIPAEALLREPEVILDDTLAGVEWRRFPLRAMAKRGWIPDAPDLMDRAEDVMRDLVQRAGGPRVAAASMFRKNDHRRVNAKTDEYALSAWCWEVLARANARPPETPYLPGTVTPGLLRNVAQFSRFEDGPRRAVDLLGALGIAVEMVPHLPRTYLDGAALRVGSGPPVIGLTLRYDRIDNFWFCLLHELAHVGRHLDAGEDASFMHDHSLRGSEEPNGGSKETEADELAEEALVPKAAWDASEAARHPSGMAVMALASDLDIHPAIVAGRVRYKLDNYRLLSQFVGSGHVRRQFEWV